MKVDKNVTNVLAMGWKIFRDLPYSAPADSIDSQPQPCSQLTTQLGFDDQSTIVYSTAPAR